MEELTLAQRDFLIDLFGLMHKHNSRIDVERNHMKITLEGNSFDLYYISLDSVFLRVKSDVDPSHVNPYKL